VRRLRERGPQRLRARLRDRAEALHVPPRLDCRGRERTDPRGSSATDRSRRPSAFAPAAQSRRAGARARNLPETGSLDFGQRVGQQLPRAAKLDRSECTRTGVAIRPGEAGLLGVGGAVDPDDDQLASDHTVRSVPTEALRLSSPSHHYEAVKMQPAQLIQL
jgi:hypothetical protein